MSSFNKPIAFAATGVVCCAMVALILDQFLSGAKWSGVEHSTHTSEQGSMLFPPSVQERLDQAQARGGALEAALVWHTIDDLDLHCREPGGNEIWFRNNVSETGGELDVDQNAREPDLNSSPVEHITWSESSLSFGSYEFRVVVYRRRTGDRPLPCELLLKREGQVVQTHQLTLGGNDDSSTVTLDIVSSGVPLEPTDRIAPPVVWRSVLITSLWAGLIGGVLAAALASAQGFVSRRGLMVVDTLKTAAIGLLGGLGSGAMSELVFSQLQQIGSAASVSMALSWGLMGSIVAWAVAKVIPNLSLVRSALAGAMGGAVGGVSLHLLGPVYPVVGRVAGAALLGGAIGLMVAVVEAWTAEATIVVQWSPKEQSKFSLGRRPVTIGGSSASDIRLDPRVHPAQVGSVRLRDGAVVFERADNGVETQLRNGSELRFGAVRATIVALPARP